jgi:hypothetical protein
MDTIIQSIIKEIINEANKKISSQEPLNLVLSLNKHKANGLYLEFGVWKGNSIITAKNCLDDWTIVGFDSFEGLPEKWREGFDKGCFSLFGKQPDIDEKIHLVKGWFQDTIPVWLENSSFDKADIIHIDCDLYSSTVSVLNLLKKLICTDTILVFDEMINYPNFENGEIKAFAEFIIDTGFSYEILYSGGYNLEKIALKII